MIEFIKKLLTNIFGKKIEESPKMVLTLDKLFEINGKLNKAECEYYIDALNKILPLYEINTPLRICHFLAQVLHESGHLKYKSENLNYSASALQSVFKKYFKTEVEANAYARKPEKIANKVYANRMGNDDEASGDGYKYRGRGLIQLTGKTNYSDCAKYIGADLVNDPDLICKYPEISIKAACWFWNKNNLNSFADKDDVLTITKRINGGTNGLDDRKKILGIAKSFIMEN